MQSLFKRNMSRDEIIEQLKIVFSECPPDEFKTKRFKGLLFDRIPDHIGLKARLEIMGQCGALEKILKISPEDARGAQKIEKIAAGFSKTYGFVQQEVLDTFDLCLKANEIHVTLTDMKPLDLPIGNYSKQHFEPSTGNIQIRAKSTVQPVEQTREPRQIKKRNIFNLLSVILFIGAMGGLLAYMWVQTDLKLLDLNYLLVYPWGVWIIGGISALVALAYLFEALFKYNIVSLYPLIATAVQIAVAAIYRDNVALYNQIQVAIWLMVVGSFLPITVSAVKLPRKKKDVLAYKAIGSYYLIGIVFFTFQYMTRLFI